MKHRHKWKLEYVNGGTIGRGLLYGCDCGSCLEFKKKHPNIKEVVKAYDGYINYLRNLIK